ncbi:MAG: RNA polymerase sigma factor [Lachnospiraceae bacterium]|jgi:RNA polymerase sigma factor (sigma-70 family)|nr:RNA polymerase sigma factor [Lachnospiraceae bacterium]
MGNDANCFIPEKYDSNKYLTKDDLLIKQAKAGDENAAELLIRRYYSSILRYCRWHCPNLETAEDLTQETFIRLFRHLHEYKERGTLKAYLYTIANRLCIDESRKIGFSPLHSTEIPAAEDSSLHQIEERDQIRYLLKFLSPEQREAVLLRFEEELSFSEIARITGCSLRTAQSRVRNGLKIMRKEMGYVSL